MCNTVVCFICSLILYSYIAKHNFDKAYRSFAELFGSSVFSHMVWVDQSPLQNYTSDGSWSSTHGNRGCNSAAALAHMQATLLYKPDDVYNGTIVSCLAYRSHPLPSDNISETVAADDEQFFRNIAREGDPIWFGKLMADHTSLDWRDSIGHSFGGSSKTRILVVASHRSGCFPAAGPLSVVNDINNNSAAKFPDPIARGLAVDWGGHWCYWENPKKFNELALEFLMAKTLG